MKKIIAVLLMLAMVLTFAACGAKEEAPVVEEAPAAEAAPAEKAPEEAPVEETPAEEAPVEEENADPYYFGTKGIEIRIMDEAEGVLATLQKRLEEAEDDETRAKWEAYQSYRTCPDCGGARLRPESRAATVAGKTIVALLPDTGERYLSTWLFE